MTRTRRVLIAAAGLLAGLQLGLHAAVAAEGGGAPDAGLPLHLHETGLYATGTTKDVSPGIVGFTPQYPLWSDGAEKRRWLFLPAGSFIDASRPDAWQFPPGTRLWKEFAHGGRPVETRLVERLADGSWRFATYVWNAQGDDAVLAPAAGIPALPVPGAPGGRYRVPGRDDCEACHGSAPVPVLGVGALQLSPDRDPLAAGRRPPRRGDVDLAGLMARRWVRGAPASLVTQPPRIAAATPVERAALGYLHGNCGHCHNRSDNRVPVRLTLAQRVADPVASRVDVLASAVDAATRYRTDDTGPDARVIAPGRPQHSVLALRMHSRNPQVQMPPLGTLVPDPEGLALVERWIASDLSPPKEPSP